MSERENTSLPEKEKTLKESTFASSSAKATDDKKASVDEKVDKVRGLIRRFPLTRWTRPVEEALTALEERVEELEKDKLTLFERQALSVVLTWQDGGWDNNERLRKAMLVFYATCREQYPDIILGIKDLSEEARDAEE